jgi:hypothetical protein
MTGFLVGSIAGVAIIVLVALARGDSGRSGKPAGRRDAATLGRSG